MSSTLYICPGYTRDTHDVIYTQSNDAREILWRLAEVTPKCYIQHEVEGCFGIKFRFYQGTFAYKSINCVQM